MSARRGVCRIPGGAEPVLLLSFDLSEYFRSSQDIPYMAEGKGDRWEDAGLVAHAGEGTGFRAAYLTPSPQGVSHRPGMFDHAIPNIDISVVTLLYSL